jgi:hypothetical protein
MADITIGSLAPDFDLPRDGGGRVKLADFHGKAAGAVLLSKGRHIRLHDRITGFHRACRGVRKGRHCRYRHVAGLGRMPRSLHQKA